MLAAILLCGASVFTACSSDVIHVVGTWISFSSNFARLFALLTAMRIIFPKKVGVPTRNWIILRNFAPVKNDV